MGGLINPKENLPIGVSELDMARSDFKYENDKLRRLLAILVNNKSNSPEFKEAKKQAIDFLQSPPGAHLSNLDRQILEKQNKEKFEKLLLHMEDFPGDTFWNNWESYARNNIIEE